MAMTMSPHQEKKKKLSEKVTLSYKLLIAIISCPNYMWPIRIKAAYLILIKISAMFIEA